MKSIIFNQHQVNHALKNKEGMFRVVVKPQLRKGWVDLMDKYPYQVGQKIFVKEAFDPKMEFEDELRNNLTCYSLAYKADFDENDYSFGQWKSPVHMKQEHSRLTLRIKSVKVERLQDIKEDGAKKEGFAKTFEAFPRANVIDETTSAYGNFIKFWNSTHKKPEEKWEANPWVFVYEYEVVR